MVQLKKLNENIILIINAPAFHMPVKIESEYIQNYSPRFMTYKYDMA